VTALDNEVELISDGDGLAVIGKPTAVERFMASVGLSSDAGSPRLGAVLSAAGAAVAQAGSGIAANSGRWVKLTEESAQAVKEFGLMDTQTPGVSHAMVGQPGDIKQWIQIVKAPGSMVSNPAMLAGAAGIMAQIAMQQRMDTITDYLATIDQKLDHVLRAQTNQVLARLDGVDFAVRGRRRPRSTLTATPGVVLIGSSIRGGVPQNSRRFSPTEGPETPAEWRPSTADTPTLLAAASATDRRGWAPFLKRQIVRVVRRSRLGPREGTRGRAP
jgi:hypothetical protein